MSRLLPVFEVIHEELTRGVLQRTLAFRRRMPRLFGTSIGDAIQADRGATKTRRGR